MVRIPRSYRRGGLKLGDRKRVVGGGERLEQQDD